MDNIERYLPRAVIKILKSYWAARTCHSARTNKTTSAEVPSRLKNAIRGTAADLFLSLPNFFESHPYSTRMFQEIVPKSLELQLKIVRRAMQLTTAAFLWPDPESRSLHLLGIASSRPDIRTGPYPLGSGILAALLKDRNEVCLSPVINDRPGIPYYKSMGGVGSFMAVKLRHHMPNRNDTGILCVDRPGTAAWDKEEKKIIRDTADKLAIDIQMVRTIRSIETERSVIHKLCIGFRELNQGLGRRSVFQATIKAIFAFMKADFIAVSLLKKEVHYVAHVYGRNSERFRGMQFERHEGLVGNVMKYNLPLPPNGVYNGPAPIFSNSHPMKGFNSLCILPLTTEKGEPMGALTVASEHHELFTRQNQEILGLIADQVAIKIDLAHAHDKISKMATTDGLTGLANHRTFQHAFDRMLHRAKRQQRPLSLILCDLDHFKTVNDTYGHPVGDKLLKAVARVLKDAVRKEDLAARYGGEEFALILEGSEVKGAYRMAERIRKAIRRLKILHKGDIVEATLSLGIVSYPKDGDRKSSLIEYADQALYKAKNSGRNRTVCRGDL